MGRDPAVWLMSLTLQLLATLTLPHMHLEAWLTRRVRFAAKYRLQRLLSSTNLEPLED
jgi:hypothetical protein